MAINLFPEDYSLTGAYNYTPGLSLGGSGYGMTIPGMENYGGMNNWGLGGTGLGMPNQGGGSSFLSGMIGTKEAPGWGGMALGAVSGLANAFMSMQQYGLAKKTLAENQRQFNLNYGAQRDTTNTALRDRQAARVASNPGAYQSVDDYMRENQIR